MPNRKRKSQAQVDFDLSVSGRQQVNRNLDLYRKTRQRLERLNHVLSGGSRNDQVTPSGRVLKRLTRSVSPPNPGATPPPRKKKKPPQPVLGRLARR